MLAGPLSRVSAADPINQNKRDRAPDDWLHWGAPHSPAALTCAASGHVIIGVKPELTLAPEDTPQFSLQLHADL